MKTFFAAIIFVSVAFLSKEISAEEISKADWGAYIEGCKHGLSQAKPTWDRKDIEMLCSDPYLVGKKNESKEDKARRMKLIKKTNEDKEKMLNSAGKANDELKNCFDAFLAVDPSKDLKDVKMLCLNPYLTPTPNESAEDQARRKRLIGESEAQKEKALSKFLEAPKSAEPGNAAGSNK